MRPTRITAVLVYEVAIYRGPGARHFGALHAVPCAMLFVPLCVADAAQAFLQIGLRQRVERQAGEQINPARQHDVGFPEGAALPRL